MEPVLGPVRVAGVRQPEEEGPENSHVFVSWRDEHGPGTATGRYPSDRSFDVRMPAPDDRLLVRRGIDQAQWLKREITDDTARLIAGHLHPGERSALHRFTLDGSVDEQLYDELEAVAQHRLSGREWVDALARYCLSREDTGPIKAWRKQATRGAEARTEEWLAAAGICVDALHRHAKANGNGKPGARPYWTTPGGSVELGDPSVEAALARELREELGAAVNFVQQVLLISSPTRDGVGVQHFFVCRLRSLDPSRRSGSEFDDPARGTYDLDRVPLSGDDLAAVDLKSEDLRTFVLANRIALLDAAGFR